MYDFVEYDGKTWRCENANEACRVYECQKRNYDHVCLYINGYLVAENRGEN